VFVARKQDLDDTVAIHPTSAEGGYYVLALTNTQANYLFPSRTCYPSVKGRQWQHTSYGERMLNNKSQSPSREMDFVVIL